MYLGNQPALNFTSFAKQDFTTSATTSYTLDNPVANANELALFINFVRQEPTTAYSASGTSLTLTESTSVGDDMYCVYLGKAVQTVNPPNNSVGTSQLVDDAVTKDKLIAHNYPAFEAYLSADQSLTSNTDTKIQFNTEVYDTDSDYDNSTNYRFTPTVAGKYYVYARIRGDSSGINNVQRVITYIYKNGSQVISARDYTSTGTPSNSMTPVVVGIIDMNGSSDYLEAYVNVLVTGGTPSAVGGSTIRYSNFGAYRIGD